MTIVIAIYWAVALYHAAFVWTMVDLDRETVLISVFNALIWPFDLAFRIAARIDRNAK